MSRVTLSAQRLQRWDAYPSAAYGTDDMRATIGLAAFAASTVVVLQSRGYLEIRDAATGTVSVSDG